MKNFIFGTIVAGLVLAHALPVRAANGAFQGTWKFVAASTDGKADPDTAIAKLQFIVDGDKYRIVDDGKEQEVGTLKLAKEGANDTIDWVIESGDDKGKTQHGIYKLAGDTAELAYFAAAKDGRPTEFASKEGVNTSKIQKLPAGK